MTNEKMSAEEAAEEYVESRDRLSICNSCKGLATKTGYEHYKAFLAGDSNGYARGKAEEQKRIWEEIQSRVYDELTLRFIRESIFGGGDVD